MNMFSSLNATINNFNTPTFKYAPVKKQITNEKEILTYINCLYKQIDGLKHEKDMMFIKIEKMERKEKNRLQK